MRSILLSFAPGTLFRRLAALRVAVARRPADVPVGTVLLLPIRSATLHCGLAGLVEVVGPRPWPVPAEGLLPSAVEKTTTRSVGDLGEEGAGWEEFAGGEKGPAEVLRLAHHLRRPAALDCVDALPRLEREAATAAQRIDAFCAREEGLLEEIAATLPSAVQEALASRLVTLRDAAWSLEREFLGGLARARALAGDASARPRVVREMRKISSVLDAVDRIEVRGRDSAGVVVMVNFPTRASWTAFERHLETMGALDGLRRRVGLPDLPDGAVTVPDTGGVDRPLAVGFVRKVAEEVGALGDNVAALRRRITSDVVLHEALDRSDTTTLVLGHTRWASNGIIHEANCHPVDNETVPESSLASAPGILPQGDPHPLYGRSRGRLFVALNGDVDNHIELHDGYAGETGRRGCPRVTTDTRVIALRVDRLLRSGLSLEDAFRGAAAELEGSAAVAMTSDLEPGRLFVSLRGSGQSVYIGEADDGFVLSSEVYGLVHETRHYRALEGERERVPGDRNTRGTVAVLDAGAPSGPPKLLGFDGSPIDAGVARTAEITTRDVDRGDFPHFFRKEIAQSPASVARTLRGKFALGGADGRRLRMNLGREILPESVETRLRSGSVRRIVCVGQGTASVAAAAVASFLREDLDGAPLQVRTEKASELSGFGLREDMSDTLILAVTQSGSTADTNRAVDLARRRGAAVIAIVNRRNSDITRRADGVFYTSDGRDVEMSVASTKAFHGQVVAGAILSLALARILGTLGEGQAAERAAELRRVPATLSAVLALDDHIAEVARNFAPTRRHWAVIGSGTNRIAADEIRIKCSELCYKSISADTVEDKKHIDLSSESLMLVLTAGNPAPVQGDLVKDVAIFHAHKALPVVFADEGERRYDPYARAVIAVPAETPRLALLAQVCAGHLFAYHAARAIDEGARYFSRLRAMVVSLLDGTSAGPDVVPGMEEAAAETGRRLRAHRFESALGPGAAADLVLLLHGTASGLSTAAMREAGERFGASGAGALPALVAALTEAIRELERPVDAIRHQAKIVTVGTSRSAERPAGPLFDALEEAGVHLDAVPEISLAALRALGPALASVQGWARYRVEHLEADGEPSERSRLFIEQRGGVSAQLPSRAEGGTVLRGTKRGVVAHRRIFTGIGAKDGRTLVIVPLVDARLHCTAIVLLHVEFRATMPVEEKVAVLGPHRMEEIVNGVTEADIRWTDALLDPLTPQDLFARGTESIIAAIVARQRG